MIRPRALLLLGACALAIALIIGRRDASATAEGCVVFSATTPGCPIVVPARASDAELRAAKLISKTLAAAAGRAEFPIVREAGSWAQRGIFVGETRHGSAAVAHVRGQPPFDDVFALTVAEGAAVLRSARPAAIEIAAGWMLEKVAGAHWFMPGPLGTEVPRRRELILPAGETRVRPAFLSRTLGVDRAWAVANKLEARLEHGHAYAAMFKREHLLANLALAPMRAGARFIPAADGMQGWQPDLTATATVWHAANHIKRVFEADPARESVAFGQNDSVRYDDSAETLARVSPLRWFRWQPDYTPLVFRFTNAVANEVAAEFPTKWIGAYAYDWTENAPSFRIAPNVVPWLTADRAQWFEPGFVAEDKATKAGWVRSGARIVGTYDYHYGAPFLVPRPTLYAVAAIPEIHAAGVRAFYAESNPNWGLDGPKAWLAAQLVWNPRRPITELLDLYYREFWREAGEPMRVFFASAERAWLTQPKPGYWIKYYYDEHQAGLFPPALRREMGQALDRAASVATNGRVRERVAFTRAAFDASMAFVEFCAARDALVLATASAATRETELARGLTAEATARDAFHAKYANLRKERPQAIQTEKLEMYVRNSPAGAARWRLSLSADGRRLLARAGLESVGAAGPELLDDPAWAGVVIGETGGTTTFEWAGSPAEGQWRGHGDPFETRSITWGADVAAGRAIRFAGCKQETLGLWRRGAVPGHTYVGRARVRGKVSPGNATFLIVTFFDEKLAPIAMGHTIRLPAGEVREWAELAVVEKAPPNAHGVAIGLRIMNQVNDDFAEFAGISLRAVSGSGP